MSAERQTFFLLFSFGIIRHMAKKKIVYFCDECGFDSPQWLGKCPSCEAWNTFKEMTINPGSRGVSRSRTQSKESIQKKSAKPLSSVKVDTGIRLSTGSDEFNRVLGGGLYSATTVLLVGEPGIGKSTLLLQVAGYIANQEKRSVLYVSAEESLTQLRTRAERLNIRGDSILCIAEHDFDGIADVLQKEKPQLIIVDSVQAIADSAIPSSPGTVTQVREITGRLSSYVKQNECILLLIGHVTKDGTLAGPRTLEHMVDVVVYFEGDRYQQLRMVRTIKNRYGSTGEVGLFEMSREGLVDIVNPSDIFLSGQDEITPGRVTVPVMEGERSFVVEVQALTNKSSYNNPLRRSLGVESNKASLLIAVIERSLGITLGAYDVFLKAVGGLRLTDAATDLALVCAIISSYYNVIVPNKHVIIGEVGLSGEIRKVHAIEERVKAADRLGFSDIIIPKNSSTRCETKANIMRVSHVREIFDLYFKARGKK